MTTCLCGGWCLLLSKRGGPGSVPTVRSGTAYGPAGQFPAGLHQMNHASHSHKHALLLITEDSDDNRSNQPQIQTGCGRR